MVASAASRAAGARGKSIPRSRYQIVIGWNESVDLPDWGIRGIRAKVDTGALSSALHVENLVELPHERARFEVIVDRGGRRRRVRVEAPIHRRGRVRSSSGHSTNRIFVKTTLRAGPVTYPIELSLIDRGEMRFRMLLGRSALSGRFLIDVRHRGLLGRARARSGPRR